MDEIPARLSVVIAVHNGAGYANTFAQCFETAGHDPDEVEFVIVDDGSTDEGADEFRRALAPFGRVKSRRLDTPLGPGAARNVGLEHATAPYVTFWDADDFASPVVYLTLVSRMQDGGGTIGSVGYSVVRVAQQEVAEKFLPDSSAEPADLLATRVGVWRFVFLRDFLVQEGIRFPSERLGEDLQFLLKVLESARGTPEVVRRVGYTYLWRQGNSASGSASPSAYSSLLPRLLASTKSFRDPTVRATSANWSVRIWLRCDLGGKARAALGLTALLARVAVSGQSGRTLSQLRQAQRVRLS